MPFDLSAVAVLVSLTHDYGCHAKAIDLTWNAAMHRNQPLIDFREFRVILWIMVSQFLVPSTPTVIVIIASTSCTECNQ